MIAAAPSHILPCYEQQSMFRSSEAPIRGFVGGRGCGKTRIGWVDLVMRAKSGRLYLVVSPTYVVMRLTTWRTAKQIGKELGIIVDTNETQHSMRIKTRDGGEAEVVFRSADNPDSLRGPNAAGAWLDEGSLMAPEVLPMVKACLREKGCIGWLSITFTPRGRRHWTYTTFYEPQLQEGSRVPIEGTFLVTAKSADNPFLHPDFVEQNRRMYTSAMASQELEGEFIDFEGMLFQRAWFNGRRVNSAPAHCQRIRYWDKAFGTGGHHKRTAGVLMAYDHRDGLFYVEHCIAEKLNPGERNRMMRETADADRAKYPRNAVHVGLEQEGGSGGPESAEISVRELMGHPVYVDKVAGSKLIRRGQDLRPNEGKIARAAAFAAACENGMVRLVEGTWVEDWLDEITMFPDYSYCDRVDASTGAFNRLVAMSLSHTRNDLSYNASSIQTQARAGVVPVARPNAVGSVRFQK